MIRYFGDFVISTLQYSQLKVAKPSELNDPFDFNIETVGDVNVDTAESLIDAPGYYRSLMKLNPTLHRDNRDDQIKALLEGLDWKSYFYCIDKPSRSNDDNFRLLCFCDPDEIENTGDILMWSHYGNQHKGVRLHFNKDFLGHDCKPVHYPKSEERVMIPPNDRFDINKYIEKNKEAYFTKAHCWNYEKEIRMLLTPAHCINDIQTGFDYVKYPATGVTRADIGMKASVTLKTHLHEIFSSTRYEHVDLRQAVIHPTKFKISYNSITVDELLL